MIEIAGTGALFGGVGALTGSILWGTLLAGVLGAIIVAADDAWLAYQRNKGKTDNVAQD